MSPAPPAFDVLCANVLAGPDWFALKLDLAAQRMLFVGLDRQTFAQASFLDERVLGPETQGAWASFAQVDAILEGALPPARPLHFIFHYGHTGSTLLSRLLESAGGVLSLREPLALRSLAEGYDGAASAGLDARSAQQIRLWRRGYGDTSAIIVKATSSAARIAPQLLAQASEARAIYLTLEAEPFLATLLAGAHNRADLEGHGAERARRLERFTGMAGDFETLSLGEAAAMAWTVESLTRVRAGADAAGRILRLDFDGVLADPAAALRSACGHLGLEAAESFFSGAVQSPVFTRYAKIPSEPYSPALRRRVLDAARISHADEIQRGLAWIERAARRSSEIAALLT